MLHINCQCFLIIILSHLEEFHMSREIQCKILLRPEVISNMLNGVVEITTSEEIVIKSAFVEIKGTASCRWTLDKHLICRGAIYKKNSSVSGEDQFYFTRHTICGKRGPRKQDGVEYYPFKCHWTSRLPSTWTGEFGKIIYLGKVCINIVGEASYEHIQEIIVKTKRDLKLEKHLQLEARVNIRKNFSFVKHNQFGCVDISTWVPICGIAAGQPLPVLCTVFNDSELHFGGLIFILTRIDIYRSTIPIKLTKTVRTDICRVARMVDIHRGKYEYYTYLKTTSDVLPTNQYYNCNCCQIIYELWVSLQGVYPRFTPYGYPDIYTPAIPIIIGTDPLSNFDIKTLTIDVLNEIFFAHSNVEIEQLPPDEEMEKILLGTPNYDAEEQKSNEQHKASQ